MIYICDNLNAELIKVSEWFRSNKLSLKAKNTNIICFGNTPLRITLGSRCFCMDDNFVDHCKFLGIIVD